MGHGHMGHGHMGHGHMHGDKHRPFGSVKKYISHLDRSDRDTWQKPEAVITRLGLKPAAVVADVGAGSGYFSLRIAKRYPKGRVIAIDIEPKMLVHIQKRARELNLSNVSTARATASDPQVDSKPDLVFVADVLHHVPDQPAWLGRMFKAMRPGARLAIIEFKEGDLPKGPPAHIKIPRAKLLGLLTSAGFVNPVVDDKLLPYQLLVVLQKPTKK
jgi:ubiquinone/menaquinone biosynthesis C-methylase UbiE